MLYFALNYMTKFNYGLWRHIISTVKMNPTERDLTKMITTVKADIVLYG